MTSQVEITPAQWDEHKDARSDGGAEVYPNQTRYRSKSGHLIEFDDSQGSEHITITHRSGAKMQMLPNGEVILRAHRGMQQIVFGNNQVAVTGTQDITVKGGASWRVEGDYNMHVVGNHHTTVEGKMELAVAKSINFVTKGDFHTAGKDIAVKAVEGNMEISADKNLTLQGDGGMSIGTTKSGADLVLKAAGELSMGGTTETRIATSSGKVKIKASSKINIDSTGDDIVATAQNIRLN